MLVHICCSVDSHYFISELQKAYPNEDFIGFFYNPNIHPKAEYDLRLNDVRRSCDMLGVRLIEGNYDVNHWLCGVRGMEHLPEKGERCVQCFDIRLEESAKIAASIGEKTFTSTLLASPMKEQHILYEQGDEIAKSNGLEFIKVNVRVKGGVERQNALAKKDNLYRQNYCGCQFALGQQRLKQGRFNLEMMSDISRKILPASIEERQEVFAKRDELERLGRNYILRHVKQRVWRLLIAKISYNNIVIPSYVLANSESKNLKVNNISWSNILVDSLEKHTPNKKISLCIGYTNKDDSILLRLGDVNRLINARYDNISALLRNPISYKQELQLRDCLCGQTSINPIVIIESLPSAGIESIHIAIQSIFQDEKTFSIVELD